MAKNQGVVAKHYGKSDSYGKYKGKDKVAL